MVSYTNVMRGFTLIELVVVVAIIVIMTSLGVPAFQRFGAQQELDQAAEQVASSIRQAQALALAPQGGVSSYSVTFTPPNQIAGSVSAIPTFFLPAAVSFSIPSQWTFNVPDQGRLLTDQSVTLVHRNIAGVVKVISGSAASGLIEIR